MAVYAKTPKGLEAMETRVLPLPRRAWQLLIMIDGKQDSAIFGKAFPGDTLEMLITLLLAGGLIEQRSDSPIDAAPAFVADPSVSAAATRDAEDSINNIRKLMINTTLSFAGHVGGPLVQKVRDASSLDDLRGLRPEWHKTVAQNPMAIMQLQTLEKHLDKLFR